MYLVTQGRAEQVWIRRKGATNVASEPVYEQQTQENQELATESDSLFARKILNGVR